MSNSNELDLLIIGAGPAGVGAALAAAECGLNTLIIDAAANSGGQIYRALPEQFQLQPNAKSNAEQRIAAQQRAALAASAVDCKFDHIVWSVDRDFCVHSLGPNGIQSWQPRALLIASGTYERVVPFPGWTLPGVIGLAAATILLKSQFILPGQKTLVAGCGPLLAYVASRIIHYGGTVVAVVDLASRQDWLTPLPKLLAQPTKLAQGLYWRGQIHKAGSPWLYRHMIKSVHTSANGLNIQIAALDRQGQPLGPISDHVADCITVGHGLTPATEISRLLGAQHDFMPALGGWVPTLDRHQRSSIPRLYIAGDCAGIRGAAAAYPAGRIAAYAAALDLGSLTEQQFLNKSKKYHYHYKRAAMFGQALARLMTQDLTQVQSIAGDTIVCRCEDVTRNNIETALEQGAANLNQLKSWTRCGMGPCQGRMCADTVAALASNYLGERATLGYWTPRIPLRPIALDAFTGAFDYQDIPIPQAAPL